MGLVEQLLGDGRAEALAGAGHNEDFGTHSELTGKTNQQIQRYFC